MTMYLDQLRKKRSELQSEIYSMSFAIANPETANADGTIPSNQILHNSRMALDDMHIMLNNIEDKIREAESLIRPT